MDEEEDVLFQDFLHKLKLPKTGRFNRLAQVRWKMKYFVLSCRGDKLMLRYYNKKPKQLHSGQPKQQIDLWPSFKVEKLSNAHNRAFATELTAPSHQLCLSADDQVTLDKFVFLLQTQVRLRDNITDNLIEVKTDSSVEFSRIGAKGVNCLLHVSPWGLTLVLQHSRSVLAQWPLKSIRYYESSGQGQFSIEAGMVAPMGEGVFHFWMVPGLDNRLYDTVDRYVISTLDRVKPNQRGTPEEIQDYIREFDCLHSLTVLAPSSLTGNEEVSKALRDNWSALHLDSEPDRSRDNGSTSSSTQQYGAAVMSAGAVQQSASPSSPTPPARPPLVSDNTNRPLPSPNMPRSDRPRYSPRAQNRTGTRGSPAEERRLEGRPPPPPPRGNTTGSGRVARSSPRSPRQDSQDAAAPPSPGSLTQPRRHSNPASVALRVSNDRHPSVSKQLSYDSEASRMTENTLSHTRGRAPDSLPSPSSPQGSAGRSSCPVPAESPRTSGTEQGAGGEHRLDTPIEDWLVSASCEDLSDHMRAVIFHQRQSQKRQASSLAATQNTTTENNNSDFIPPPFTNIVDFRTSVDWERSQAQSRDRSQSFDINAKTQKKSQLRNGASSGSASPSIKQIRKMVSARSATKENLRKSLSNPNYLNLGSKEKLYQHRLQTTKSSGQEKADAAKLSSQQKQKSRSLVNLLSSSLRRYISRESLSHPSSSSPSPDTRHARQRNGDAAPQGDGMGHFCRQYSAGSLREMSIKGVRFTERSRSFRRPKGYQRSKSAEPYGRAPLDDDASTTVRDNSDSYLRSQSTPDRDCPDVEDASGGGEGQAHAEDGGTETQLESDLCARNVTVNGVRPLPPQPEWKLRLPSRSTSQSSC